MCVNTDDVKLNFIQRTSIDSDYIQETPLDLDDEPWQRHVESAPIEAQDIKIERNGRSRRSDISKREESIRSKKEKRNTEEREKKKEIRDVSVGAPDTKESGCQTRESLFQTDTAPSSDGEFDILLHLKINQGLSYSVVS